MKRIEAIIRPEKVSEVCAALDSVGHPGVTVSQVGEHGDQKGWVNHLRGRSYTVSLLSKTRVEVVVKDEDANKIIKTIINAALTSEAGDGKILVHDVANAIQISANESVMAAI